MVVAPERGASHADLRRIIGTRIILCWNYGQSLNRPTAKETFARLNGHSVRSRMCYRVLGVACSLINIPPAFAVDQFGMDGPKEVQTEIPVEGGRKIFC